MPRNTCRIRPHRATADRLNAAGSYGSHCPAGSTSAPHLPSGTRRRHTTSPAANKYKERIKHKRRMQECKPKAKSKEVKFINHENEYSPGAEPPIFGVFEQNIYFLQFRRLKNPCAATVSRIGKTFTAQKMPFLTF
jgi:hypothetical protein